jgi:hypothetical protein
MGGVINSIELYYKKLFKVNTFRLSAENEFRHNPDLFNVFIQQKRFRFFEVANKKIK